MIDMLIFAISVSFSLLLLIILRNEYKHSNVINIQNKTIKELREGLDNSLENIKSLENILKQSKDIISLYSDKYVAALKDLLACYKAVNMKSEVEYIENVIKTEQRVKELHIDTISIGADKNDETIL